MTGAQTIMRGIIVLFISILMGITCNYGLLVPMTTIQDGFSQAGVYELDNYDWDTRTDIDRLVTYLHICVYLMPILGLVFFGVSIIKVLYYETEEDEYSAGQQQIGRF